MKLIEQMKKSVEGYWEYIKAEDPYNRAILDGTVKPEMVSHFLVNVHHLVHHTPIHLRRARDEAAKRNQTELKEYFETKMVEEQGHDQWAEADLKKLQKAEKSLAVDPRIDPTMRALVKNIEKLIDKDPYLYLPYIFFAEYLTVLYGPEMILALESECGYQPRSLTVVENHAELDVDHVGEWEETIEAIVDAKRYGGAFLSVLSDTIKIHKSFFLSCAGKGRKLHAAS